MKTFNAKHIAKKQFVIFFVFFAMNARIRKKTRATMLKATAKNGMPSDAVNGAETAAATMAKNKIPQKRTLSNESSFKKNVFAFPSNIFY